MDRLGKTVAVALALSCATAAVGQEASRPPGDGVLCAYGIYANVQFVARECGWDRLTIDTAIDRAVSDIEVYIIANATDPEIVARTRENLRLGAAALAEWPESERQAFCEGTSNERPNYALPFRTLEPTKLEQMIKKLLSAPGEPTNGVCY